MHRVHHCQIDSTNTAAATEAARHWPLHLAAGVCESIVVSADTQTAGRGRTGRTWASPRGGAYFSLAYPLPDASAARWALVPLIAGLAIRDVLLDCTGLAERRLRIKWPNDLLLDGCKLAGILCEQRLTGVSPDFGSADDKQPTALIVGIGVNLRGQPQTLDNCRLTPTTLEATLPRGASLPGANALIEAITQRLCERLDALSHRPWDAAEHERLNAALAYRGQMVRFEQHGQMQQGICRGVDVDGSLLVELANVAALLSLKSGEIGRLTPLL